MSFETNQEKFNREVCDIYESFRGSVDSSVYQQLILIMFFLKYISDVQPKEMAKLSTSHDHGTGLTTAILPKNSYNIPKGCSFLDLFESSYESNNVGRINDALIAIEHANPQFRNMFGNVRTTLFNSGNLGNETQENNILERILWVFGENTINFAPCPARPSDFAGDVYENFIQHFAVNMGKATGYSYTPPAVSDLLSMLLEPQEGDTIYDPACGSGSLLLRLGKRIQKNFNGSKKYSLYGQEANGSSWLQAKINMFLHGEDDHRVELGDSIETPALLNSGLELMRFDVVVSNPPFNAANRKYEVPNNDIFGRFHRGIPPRSRNDYAFISHMIATLKRDVGRMAVVMPHGVLFRASSEGEIRRQLIDENLLDAVIGLPGKLFLGTVIPVVILIFKKRKTDDKVLFINAEGEFQYGKYQNQLTPVNIQRIATTFHMRKTVDKYAYLSNLKEIQENDYNLNIPRYVDTFEEKAELDLTSIKADRLSLQTELSVLESKMTEYLEKWGYE